MWLFVPTTLKHNRYSPQEMQNHVEVAMRGHATSSRGFSTPVREKALGSGLAGLAIGNAGAAAGPVDA